jgi:GTP-binding protein HflX
MGTGKLKEIYMEMLDENIETLIIDDELTPGQQRNIETELNSEIKVIDRTALILDIFAQHAYTKEGQLQVELAQCQYRLPRLTRLWTHLIRQAGGRSGGVKGGVGLRGPGETQLESDRRQLRNRIATLKKQIVHVKNNRIQHRQKRKKSGIPLAAIVGYTNAGKSSLLKYLSKADILTENKLFATLDPTIRKVKLPSGKNILFTDTVGFINKLPHELIAAFRATLEEIKEADIIIHLADITHPGSDKHIMVVDNILHELGIIDIPKLIIWNKIDKNKGTEITHKNDICISAKTGEGVDNLLNKIEDTIKKSMHHMELFVPFSNGDILNILIEKCFVEEKKQMENGYLISAFIPAKLRKHFKQYSQSS